MLYFWLVVVAVGISSRLLSLIQRLQRGQSEQYTLLENTNEDQLTSSRAGSGASRLSWLRRHLILPATFGYHRAQPVGWCTLPPRIQSLTISVFIVLNIVLCCISYNIFPGNL